MAVIFSKRKALALLSVTIASPAFAQFGGLLGGSKGGGDPGKIEGDLKGIIEKTSRVISKLYQALGNKESAEKAQKLADDISKGSLGVSDSTASMSEMCDSLKSELNKAVAEGRKGDAEAAKAAVQAFPPAIQVIPLWKSVIDGIKTIDKSRSMSGAGLALIQAAPKLPTALTNTVDALKAGVTYLTFSGVDMSDTEKALTEGLSKLT